MNQDKQAEIDFFDNIEHFGKVIPHTGFELAGKLNKFQPAMDSKVLEIGCGIGDLTKYFSHYYLDIVSIDINKKNIAIAKKNCNTEKFHKVHFLACDAEELCFKDNEFDLIIFSEVLHHIPNRIKVLNEAHRVLKPKGKAFAIEPNNRHPCAKLFREPKGMFYSSKNMSINERSLSKEELEEDFKKAGFNCEIEAYSPVQYSKIRDRNKINILIFNILEAFISFILIIRRKYGCVHIVKAIKKVVK